MGDQVAQKLELASGKLDRLAFPRHFLAAKIDRQILETEYGVGQLPSGLGAAQQRFNTRQQLGYFERLGEVIVGAQLQSCNPIVYAAACRQHQNRQIDVTLAQLAADVESTAAGEHDIQNSQIEIAAGCLNQPVLAVATGLH